MEQPQGHGRLAGLAQGFLLQSNGALGGHKPPDRPIAIGQVARRGLGLVAGDGGQRGFEADEVGRTEGIGVRGLSVDRQLDHQQVLGRRDPRAHPQRGSGPCERRRVLDPLGGAERVEHFGGVQTLLGFISAVEQGGDVQVDRCDRTGVTIGVDGLGLPEVGLGDPEAVAFRAVGRGRGARGHPGASLLAKAVVPLSFAHRTNGHPQVSVPEKRAIRKLSCGHQDRRRLE